LNALQLAKQPVHTGHSHIGNALDAIAHNFGGDRCLFGHRQIACAGADDGYGSGAFGQRLLFDGKTAGQLVVNDILELSPQSPRVFLCRSRNQDPLFPLKQFNHNFQDLPGRFTRTKNHFGKTLAQRTMSIYLREAEVSHGGCLESAQDFSPADGACTKSFQKSGRFSNGHAGTVPRKVRRVTQEKAG